MRNFRAGPPAGRAARSTFLSVRPGDASGELIHRPMIWFTVFLVAWSVAWWGVRVRDARRRSGERDADFGGLDALPPPPRTDRRAWNERLARLEEWVGPVMLAVIMGAYLVPLWWESLPGGLSRDWWSDRGTQYVAALLTAWHVFQIWRATRERFPVAAFGPPRLTLAPGPSEPAETPAMLATPAPPAPRDGYDRAGSAIVWGGAGLFAVWFASLVDWKPTLWMLVAMGATAAINHGLRRWWDLPAPGDLWLTEVGVVVPGSLRPGRRVAWEEVDRVAVAPVPAQLGSGKGGRGIAVELLADDRLDRFLVAPGASDRLNELLAAVPPDRLVRADGDEPPAVASGEGGLG